MGGMELPAQIKSFLFFLQDRRRDVVLFTLFFLVSVISFSLGYVVAGEGQHAPIIIQKNSQLL